MSRKKVLVIDDDQDIRSMVHTILTAKGYTVGAAKDAEEGFKYAMQPGTDSSKHQYDLIMIDIRLGNQSGLDLLDKIRKSQRADLNLMMISGAFDVDEVKKAAAFGIKGFIVKPFTSKVLVEKVSAVLDAFKPSSG